MSKAMPYDAATLGLTLVLCLATPAAANPLNLGEEEFETDDRSVMEGIIEHCTGLKSEAASEEAAGPQQEDDAGDRQQEDEPGQPEGFGGSDAISADRLASGDEKGEAPDLSNVTVEDCAAAGIIY